MHFTTLVAAILLLYGCNCTKYPVTLYIYPQTVDPQITYYNLRGEIVITGSTQQKRIVLLKSANKDSVIAFIKAGNYIKVPTIDLLQKMDSCFSMTENTNHEHGFVAGVNDSVSLIVKGKRKAMKKKHRLIYFNDLAAKRDLPAFDVHSHPKHQQEINDTLTTYGTVIASADDMQCYYLGGFDTTWQYDQPSVLLAYEPDSTKRNEDGRFVDTVPFIRYIGFYTIKDSNIFCLPYDSFVVAVCKIMDYNKVNTQEVIVSRQQRKKGH